MRAAWNVPRHLALIALAGLTTAGPVSAAYTGGLSPAGQVPKEQTLLLLRSACVNLDDAECTNKATEQLVKYTPQPKYWKELLDPMFRSKGQSDASLLMAYRLKSAVDAMESSDDYIEFAELAMRVGSPGEAQKVIETGTAKGVFNSPTTTDQSKKLLASAKRSSTPTCGAKRTPASRSAGRSAGRPDRLTPAVTST